MTLLLGRAYNMESVALRFFNVFGTRQALSNPYTGVLAIFASRYLNNKPPIIFEDGRQMRDFVSVHDVVNACRLALETPGIDGKVFNIGSGRQYSILEVAEKMAAVLGKDEIKPLINGKYRVGDIRNCFADITQSRELLGYNPRVFLDDGLVELLQWLQTQVAYDRVEAAANELTERGLAI
jgi:dTDP-L-rhamnose 4-epimerase